MIKRIDLHTHSDCSDGSMTPRQVVAHAAELGIAAISLTDHDTVAGFTEATEAGKEYHVEVIPGVEFSTEGRSQTHILGYGFDPDNAALQAAFAAQQAERKSSHEKYLRRLNEAGFRMTHEDVQAIAPVGGIGRAHYARVMLDKGYVSSVAEAFDRYLGVGKPLYVKRQVISPETAISLIHGAGGVAFFAHPHQTKLADAPLFDYIRSLRDAGLDGLEGYYSEYTPEMEARFQAIAGALGLALSGGSDFHAQMKPHIELGYGIAGNLCVPYAVLENIRTLLADRRKNI